MYIVSLDSLKGTEYVVYISVMLTEFHSQPGTEKVPRDVVIVYRTSVFFDFCYSWNYM